MDLPVNGRNYLEFTPLAPGLAPSGGQATVGGAGSSGSSLPDGVFTFGGLRPRSNAISIDGLNNTDETAGAARADALDRSLLSRSRESQARY